MYRTVDLHNVHNKSKPKDIVDYIKQEYLDLYSEKERD